MKLVASGVVTGKLCPHSQPLEPQEAFLFYKESNSFGRKRLGNEKFDTLVTHLSVCAHVGLPSVGVDRHPGVAASTDGIEVVEGNRPVSLAQVFSCLVCN